MDPTELLRLIGERLDRIGCPRFVTGSIASTVFGEPRFTNDVGIVVPVRSTRFTMRAIVCHAKAS